MFAVFLLQSVGVPMPAGPYVHPGATAVPGRELVVGQVHLAGPNGAHLDRAIQGTGRRSETSKARTLAPLRRQPCWTRVTRLPDPAARIFTASAQHLYSIEHVCTGVYRGRLHGHAADPEPHHVLGQPPTGPSVALGDKSTASIGMPVQPTPLANVPSPESVGTV